VFVSGQLPIAPDGTKLADEPFDKQAKQALANVAAALAAAGSSVDKLVQVRVYVTSIADWPAFNAMYAAWAGPARPARAVVPVPELHHGFRVEVEAVALALPAAAPIHSDARRSFIMGFTVTGKTALVTGSNRGIGKAIGEGLLLHGAAKVYAAARDVQSVAPMVQASGGKVVAIHIDLGKPETIRAAAAACKDVQLVVNNAGVLRKALPLAADSIDALNYQIDTNVVGLIRMAQAFAPVLAANGGGAFAQLNSVASLKTFADFSMYCASKAAAYAVTQALREELGKQGTAVVSVHPGPIATEMADEAGMSSMAEPASLVAESMIAALAAGEFHAFPDSFARRMWAAYQGFAKTVVEANLMEG